MEKMKVILLHVLLIHTLLCTVTSLSPDQLVYVVFFGDHKVAKSAKEIEDFHHSHLLTVKNSAEEARASLLYSYKRSINGYAAILSADEAAKISKMDGVVSVAPSYPNEYRLHTTRSWEFIDEMEKVPWGLKALYNYKGNYGKDVIVGVLDNGIWPESMSFNDKGFGPIPKSWKGICQEGDAFNSSHCNKKLIGARYYLKAYEHFHGKLNTTAEYRSPRDHDGHGSHTSSTIAGRKVPGVSAVGGFGRGTAQGGAPMARLAMYKVCWPIPGGDPAGENTCFGADMYAAMDDAIADGVNVMSLSIGSVGGYDSKYYTSDAIALGSLLAAKYDVVVVCSAGNSGPAPSTLSNLAPWILTVAASTIDRGFPAPVNLGNGKKLMGQSVATEKLHGKKAYPFVYAGDAELNGVPKNISGQCLDGTLDPKKVTGKVVLCRRGLGLRVGKGLEVIKAGGAAYILGNSKANGDEIAVDSYFYPGTSLGYTDAEVAQSYINSTSNPTITSMALGVTVPYVKPSPSMAGFSSTGPNSVDPNILKPDITAPGVNILAAWSESSSPTKLLADTRRVKYNFESGTSMSCPHVAAAAILVRAINPHWSAAAVRSALMTTATTKNNIGLPITTAYGDIAGPFNYGSGHVQPVYAAYPGLVYNSTFPEYLTFLCGQNYTKIDSSFTCPNTTILPWNLNYPSVAVGAVNGTVTVERKVTNVGFPWSTYRAIVVPPQGFYVKITPRVLFFKTVGEEKKFKLEIGLTKWGKLLLKKGEYKFGWFAWTNGWHFVRSPIALAAA